MLDAQNSSYEQAVANYIGKNKERIDYWVTGKM
jgi:glycine betaine/proline transport system substrate-binding protein